ncbi:histone-lysine N-methyltransferase SETMAR [Plakobranchus ocellatus]|uniref:Histone-lysine N-methyltransferase SETMAR n=1 Tax=Plakobranchus ocellatus TaxID=259542 RepID=A0AAV3Y2D5_9GAST|nr:histone-lysine N-methyltransferase SETMAR [Plakobranchus ocellatus]
MNMQCRGPKSISGVLGSKTAETSLQDEPRSGRPNTANNDWYTARVDELIKVDRRVKLKEISLKLDIPKTNVYEIVHDTLKIGYRKVSARWVPKMSDEHNRQRVEISQILLHQCQQGDETVDVGPGSTRPLLSQKVQSPAIGKESDGHLVLGLAWNDPFRYSAKWRECQC